MLSEKREDRLNRDVVCVESEGCSGGGERNIGTENLTREDCDVYRSRQRQRRSASAFVR